MLGLDYGELMAVLESRYGDHGQPFASPTKLLNTSPDTHSVVDPVDATVDDPVDATVVDFIADTNIAYIDNSVRCFVSKQVERPVGSSECVVALRPSRVSE